MDPVATLGSALEIIYEIKKVAEQVQSNRVACKKLSERFAYLSTVLRRPELACRMDTCLIAQRIENYSTDVLAFMEKLMPSATKARSAKKKKGVVRKVLSGFSTVGRICKEVMSRSEIAVQLADYHVEMNELLQDLQSILQISHLLMLQPAQIVEDASVDLRNGVVMHTNNVMTQIATGHALPEDNNELPQCAEVVEQAVQELAVKIGERTGDDLLCGDARGASAQDKQKLHTFLNRQVQEIRLASQTLAREAVDLVPLFQRTQTSVRTSSPSAALMTTVWAM
ncbi:hypothetical protein EON64_09005 [archaeon]|nr:MAG: hypothetical protein EON64_09005 [archaeon]